MVRKITGCSSVVDCLPDMCEVQGSILRTKKEKKERKQREYTPSLMSVS